MAGDDLTPPAVDIEPVYSVINYTEIIRKSIVLDNRSNKRLVKDKLNAGGVITYIDLSRQENVKDDGKMALKFRNDYGIYLNSTLL
jgi:hypothetical protein